MGRIFLIVSVVIGLSACAAGIIRNPVPENLIGAAVVSEFDDARIWGDEKPHNLKLLAQRKFAHMKAGRPEIFRKANPRFDYLAISGGGSDGAFGAGLLAGWSAHGGRPEFDIVTGVSTGALAAPFVFLGPQYDDRLREIYTHYSTKQLFSLQVLAGVFGNAGAITDNSGLKKLIAKYINPTVLKEIAREHLRGRRLLIGTTNLDAQRPVIWNVGAVAVRGGKKGLRLARQIFLASSALPGVFPPVMIDVEADGQNFREMHVDGGPTAEVFFLPTKVSVASFNRKFKGRPRRRLFIIRNGKLAPEWKAVKFSPFDIAQRSLTTLTKNQGKGDLMRLYTSSRRDKIDYNLASIPADFNLVSKEAFDRDYMRALFDLGYQLGEVGYKWDKKPPES